MDYTDLRIFCRAATAVKRSAQSRGCRGAMHANSRRVGTLGEQLAAVGIYLEARRSEPNVPRQWIWESAKSAAVDAPSYIEGENHQ